MRTLKQDYHKKTFCNGELPLDEVIIIRPPSGDLNSNNGSFWFWPIRKTLYGLSCSPMYRYVRIKKILISIGLTQNIYDPSFFTVSIQNPDDLLESSYNCILPADFMYMIFFSFEKVMRGSRSSNKSYLVSIKLT